MYIIYGTGAIWDKKANALLCVFENGVYKTDNKTTYDKVIKMGYKGETYEADKEEGDTKS